VIENVIVHSMVVEHLINLWMLLFVSSVLLSHHVFIDSLSSSDLIFIADHLIVSLFVSLSLLLEFISIRGLGFFLLVISSFYFNLLFIPIHTILIIFDGLVTLL
jgi:hypothetical protein